MKGLNLPKEYVNVMITYKGSVRVNFYGDRKKAIVTRRAFYSKSQGYYNSSNVWVETPNGYFSVPQFWEYWSHSDGTRSLLPHSFYNYGRVLPDKIIRWKLDTEQMI